MHRLKMSMKSFHQKPGWNQKLNIKHRMSYKRGLDEIIIQSTIYINYIPTAVNKNQIDFNSHIAHAVSEQWAPLNNKPNAGVYIESSM